MNEHLVPLCETAQNGRVKRARSCPGNPPGIPWCRFAGALVTTWVLASAAGLFFTESARLSGHLRQVAAGSFFSGAYPLVIATGLSALLAVVGSLAVVCCCREAAGSGISEVRGALLGLRPLRWKRVIPVKFISGVCAQAAGMPVGSEGPVVQLGSSIAAMTAALSGLRHERTYQLLMGAGTAAALAAAFDAPLAGMLFVLEGLRIGQWRGYLPLAVITAGACTGAGMAYAGGYTGLLIPHGAGMADGASLSYLWAFIFTGCLCGVLSVLLNRILLLSTDLFHWLFSGRRWPVVLAAGLTGALCGGLGALSVTDMQAGLDIIPSATGGNFSTAHLFILLLLRLTLMVLCFGSGAPGGTFAPVAISGAITGILLGSLLKAVLPDWPLSPAALSLAGMAALMAGSFRTPLTAVMMVTEMTGTYPLFLPLIMASAAASLTARVFRSESLYTTVLAKTISRAADLRTG